MKETILELLREIDNTADTLIGAYKDDPGCSEVADFRAITKATSKIRTRLREINRIYVRPVS